MTYSLCDIVFIFGAFKSTGSDWIDHLGDQTFHGVLFKFCELDRLKILRSLLRHLNNLLFIFSDTTLLSANLIMS